MIPLKLIKIQQYLTTRGLASEIQHETDQLCLVLKIGTRDLPIFFRIYPGDELFQMLAFLPCTTTPETISDTARLLMMLNRESDTPGFGMDEQNNVVFFRLMLPIKNKEIDEQLFDAYLNAIQLLCRSFAAVIAAIAYGSVKFDDLLKQVESQGTSFFESQLKGD